MELKWKHFIDASKGMTPLVCLGMIKHYDRVDSPTAWAYFAMHGSYGVLWVLKSAVFPDAAWERPNKAAEGPLIDKSKPFDMMEFLTKLLGRFSGPTVFGSLAIYWGNCWLICSQKREAPAWLIGVTVFTYGIGVFLHFASDMQKHVRLQYKRGLITDLLFEKTRNPNYLGEALIYGSFAALPMHPFPPAYLLLNMLTIWFPNMLKKDSSISRHEGWKEYKSRSWMFFPKLF
eukprot:TRINITY_DN25835_c0_g1_i1.p1 TRINITY_DN25835_c0_g1~~TRINITY_DN25835_c0_g1_i1.p1  ORF type:complete len:254 (+),score=34.89 TRINITY_DN25835_c0_g1_i1:68-763(+)